MIGNSKSHLHIHSLMHIFLLHGLMRSVSLSLSVPMCTVHKIWVRNGTPWYVYLCADDEETLSVLYFVRKRKSMKKYRINMRYRSVKFLYNFYVKQLFKVFFFCWEFLFLGQLMLNRHIVQCTSKSLLLHISKNCHTCACFH